ncbi:MAG: WGR domain-containing protein [Chloroflexi bacterium]|nr:WGR domain-containing protein [Chloroflexota bacterium]
MTHCAWTLHRIDPTINAKRWYVVIVQPTLFDAHAVVCLWGRLGTDGERCRIIPATSRAEAEAQARKIVEQKVKKGYVDFRNPKHP